jgi:D-glycero-D-manno-heptose 1,7-bisphosphate phosphatase
MRRAVFVDRDGTLNRAPVREGRPRSPETLVEFEILSDVPAAAQRLKAVGLLLIVVTNQPEVSRGRVSRAAIDAMHDVLRRRLLIDDFKVCYETEEQAPRRYKPAPGMLLEAAHEFGIDLAFSYMIGDRWRDVDAGRAAGCRTVFIDRGYVEPLRARPDWIVGSFAEAADVVLRDMAGKGA